MHMLLRTIVIIFVLMLFSTAKANAQVSNEEHVHTISSIHPRFPGGQEAMRAFFAEHARTPQVVRDSNIQGQVMVSFIIERDGRVSNVEVVESLHPEADMEAVRVVEMMPNWIPGKSRNRPVRVQFHMPVNFHLN